MPSDGQPAPGTGRGGRPGRPRLARSTGSAPTGLRVFVDQAVEDGSSADPSVSRPVTVALGACSSSGTLCYAPVRPGRAVVHLVFDQNGAKV
jgi:hypothetical protein